MQKFLQTPIVSHREKTVKKMKRAKKSKKRQQKNWILPKQKLKYKNNKTFYQKSSVLRFLKV
jgi:hypothetical protein